MASGPITSWEIDGETVETVSDFILGGSKITADGDCSHEIKRCLLLGIHWKDWCWSWNSSTLATSCEELTHWKRRWCWEGMGAGGEGDDRGWDGWMASPTRWAWVWVNSGSWWWTGRPGVLQFMGSQRVRHDWVTELNWMKMTFLSWLIREISHPLSSFFHALFPWDMGIRHISWQTPMTSSDSRIPEPCYLS